MFTVDHIDFLDHFESVYRSASTGVIFSEDNKYRYVLWRNWDDTPWMTFVMLNPSTADETEDDPTIRRCIRFAKREHCGGIVVVNLFAYRAAKPELLTEPDDPKGPLNKTYIEQVISVVNGPLVAAWGAWWHTNQTKRYGHVLPRLSVEAMAKKQGVPMMCLGVTKNRQPRHPLYVSGDQPLEVFTSRGVVGGTW